MRIAVYIDPSVAIRAGKSKSGRQEVSVPDGALETLSVEERDVLARHGHVVNEGDVALVWRSDMSRGLLDEVPEPTWEHLLVDIQRIVRQEKEAAANQREREACERREREERIEKAILGILADPSKLVVKTGYSVRPSQDYIHCDGPQYRSETVAVLKDPRLASLVAQRQAEMAERQERLERAEREEANRKARAEQEKAEAAERFHSALTAWIVEHGTESQRERQAEGMLPETEALQSLRDSLFNGITLLKYQRLDGSDIDCSCGGSPDASFDSSDVSAVDAEQWEAIKLLRREAPEDALVQPRVHQAWCTTCGKEESLTERFSANVSLVWHGRTLSREYSTEPTTPKPSSVGL